MSRSRSCSRCVPEPGPMKQEKVEKLGIGETSGNPRYPHLFVGRQAIYSDGKVQIIVTVEADSCDETCDNFTLRPFRILKDETGTHEVDKTFNASQSAGDRCWKLHALL
jgi:hypothetical protein